MGWTRKLLIVIAVVLLGAILVVALSPKRLPVETDVVDTGAMQVTVEATGKMRVRHRYVVAAHVSGQLGRVELRPGDVVEEGKELASIKPISPPLLDARTKAEAQSRVLVAEAARAEAASAVERARIARDHASRELQRTRKLVEGNVLADEALDNAQFVADSRARELVSAELALESSKRTIAAARASLMASSSTGPDARWPVLSPSSGKVLRVFQESEGPVQAGTPLFEMGDPTDLELVAELLTLDAVRVRGGAPVLVDQYGGTQPLQGVVRLVEPSAFTKVSALGVEEQRVNVIVDPAAPGEWKALADGFQAQARIVVWEAASVTRIPTSALFRSGGVWSAFVVSDGRARSRVFELGQRNELHAEVLGGVAVGDRVVVFPSDKLTDGAKVEVR
jgi:HlyD family secretion protein